MTSKTALDAIICQLENIPKKKKSFQR